MATQTKAASRGGMTREEVLAAARGLAPKLAERAAEAERLRRLPDETVADLKRAGLLKVLQPKRYGGHQLDVHTHLDVIVELARACPSTGWVAGVIHAHSWLSGLFPEKAQAELYGTNPDAITCAVVAPTRGAAKKIDGGFALSGFWPFGSGCEHSDWMFLGGLVKDEAGKVTDEGFFLVPTRDIKINDDWYVAGLRGTGSCSVQGKDMFVPAHRFLSAPQAFAGEAPGVPLHDGWLYRSATVPVLDMAIAVPALGMARAALDAFTSYVKGGRVIAYTADVQLQAPVTHIELADAAIRIDSAELLLRRCIDDVEATAKAGKPMALSNRARARMDCAHAVRQCLEAVNILFLSAGGSALSEKNPLQRYQRDVQAVNMHGFLALRTNQEMYGRILLGLPQNTPLI